MHTVINFWIEGFSGWRYVQRCGRLGGEIKRIQRSVCNFGDSSTITCG